MVVVSWLTKCRIDITATATYVGMVVCNVVIYAMSLHALTLSASNVIPV